MNSTQAAAYWIIRRDSRALSPRDQAAFRAWMTVEANARAYHRVSRTWASLDLVVAEAAIVSLRRNGHPVMKTSLAHTLDASAISLSALCLIHCLALPALALALPFVGGWARAEWVHVLFVCLAAPIALLALTDWRTRRPHAWSLVALAASGLGLMLAGALEIPAVAWERPLTAGGGVILATAHILNWRRRHAEQHRCP